MFQLQSLNPLRHIWDQSIDSEISKEIFKFCEFESLRSIACVCIASRMWTHELLFHYARGLLTAKADEFLSCFQFKEIALKINKIILKPLGAEFFAKENAQITLEKTGQLIDSCRFGSTIKIWGILAKTIEVNDFLDTSNYYLEDDRTAAQICFPAWVEYHIDKLQKIEKLNLNLKGLTYLPSEIGKLKGLKSLDLSSNRLLCLPPEFYDLKGLRELYLDDNLLEHFPLEVCNLSELTHLGLSFNGLVHIPSEIGDLKRLINLYLAHNELKSIPEEICNLKNLEELTLTGNQISQLPSQITNLPNLKISDGKWTD